MIMSALKEKLIKYHKLTEEELKEMSTTLLAIDIAEYAHDGQFRENGVPYVNHPKKIFCHFMELFEVDRYSSICWNMMRAFGFPTSGVLEVIMLHDVVEDTALSHKDVKNLFKEFGYLDYFNKYIDEPLKLITHDKSVSYPEYIEKVLTNRTASFVKMLDLMDNLYLFSLKEFKDKELKRAINYLKYFKTINDKYDFIDSIHRYKNELLSPYKYDDWQ